MEILVCVKQVPDTAELKADPSGTSLNKDGVPNIVNPFDKNALEAAVQLKEAHGGRVTVLSLGPDQAKAALKECVSVGADEAVLVNDPAFAGSDAYATAHILAAAAGALGAFDLVICGKQTLDGSGGQVGPELAEQLGIPHVTSVSKIEAAGETLRVHRETDEGDEVLETGFPALVTVGKSINEPRFPSIKSKMAANKAVIRVLTGADLPGLDQTKVGAAGSPVKILKEYLPAKRQAGLKIKEATNQDSALKLVDHLVQAKLI
ncbi:Electron transfer flavoprotein alpha/beta-subunit [Syntrophobotulus glycolicus DSM 8271]|uniref:Electron transfer flavoprotein small subunit n=1 Tax=Syntrophobotulus glycolicus (strain DSM 8271 / FlGlyR) TaxID=645991 RepID=F0SU77_SYNGF|nr:electron transfer flavoprotein subunit beta/FixA family protein [Syntrophobotulus glycolicus]ADY55460.1 Electron transfer flavoprotein alpha/beta-subunit [Syntrophobotulus glycolicus DSM 8271]